MNQSYSPFEINLFLSDNKEYLRANPLKTFINYLRSSGSTGVLDFSNSFEHGLHSNISISGNLMIEISSDRLFESGKRSLEKKVQNVKNKPLIELIIILDDTSRFVSDLNTKERTLVAIIKSLLTSSDYIFIQIAEEIFSSTELQLIKEAIIFEATSYNRKVFINSKNENCWSDIATLFTTQDKNNIFKTITNPISKMNSNFSAEQIKSSKKFLSLKQVI